MTRSPVISLRSSVSVTRSFFISSQRKKLTPPLWPCCELVVWPRLLIWFSIASVTGVSLVDNATSDDGIVDLCIANRLGGNASQIAIDNHDIGKFIFSNRALVLFLGCFVRSVQRGNS